MNARRWGIVGFILIGMAASGYLTYTHFANVDPQCYGIGSCAYVQASSYAKIFGIPISLLGFLAYLAMLTVAVAAFWALDEEQSYLARPVLFGMAFAGTLYSAYLTYIEAFVLRAWCIYCVISAIAITGVCVLSGIEAIRPSDSLVV